MENSNITSIMVLRLWCLAGLVTAARAESRRSVDYEILTDAIDCAGGLAGGALRSDDISVGGITGLASSTDYTDRGGWVAQLYETLGLSLPASPVYLNEGSSLLLTVSERWDDASTWPLPNSDVSWTAGTPAGLLTISSGGVAQTGVVFQEETSSVSVQRGPFSSVLVVVVRDSNPDNFGTYAADGIPDLWQVKYFGIDNPLGGRFGDPDGDGEDNLLEFLALTNPVNPRSLFSPSVSTGVAGTEISFLSAPGRTYLLESNTTLDSASWAPWLAAVAGGGGVITIPVDHGGNRRFYRVTITLAGP